MSNNTTTKPAAKMDWNALKALFDEADDEQLMSIASIKGIPVPPEVTAALAAKAALASTKVVYGGKSPATKAKVYVTFNSGLPTGKQTASGGAAQGKAPYLILQTLDGEILRLTAARDALVKAGFPTSAGDAPVPGPDAARAAGFKVEDNR